LGFTQVFDYVGGKMDWLAYGLPREGKRTSSPYVGELVRRDVPVCHPDDRIGAIVPRVRAAGWDQCVVVNSAGVVLGLLRGEALHSAPETPVELAMQSGPTTIRPNRALADIREYMRQRGAEHVLVTTPAGQLLGMVERQAVERRLALAVPSSPGRSHPAHATSRVAIGYKLSCEEHSPGALVHYARQAEDAGFTFAMLSDHYHPWIAQQGQSPFVWSVIGSIAHATERLQVGTGVTCPLMRLHPAIVAQAAATTAALLPGRFVLGLGTGESLNEHIFGDTWPPAATRRAMLEEAVAIIRRLWHGGLQSHQGQYYTVENAQLYTLPEQLPPILIAASGPRSAHLAGRIGDGLITVGVHAKLVDRFTAAGGAGKPRYTELNVCWAPEEAAARRLAHARWPIAGLSGALLSDLRLPSHFTQAASTVTEEDVARAVVCGPDPARHIAAIVQAVEIGYTHVWVHQIGPDQAGFCEFYACDVLPKLRTRYRMQECPMVTV
jgi:coenzyme F420-dependent glucose-6-phosphate dehydrogenase